MRHFCQVHDEGENTDGPSFDASLTRRFEPGKLSLSARGGWDETDNRVMLTITGTRLFRW